MHEERNYVSLVSGLGCGQIGQVFHGGYKNDNPCYILQNVCKIVCNHLETENTSVVSDEDVME